MWFIFKAQDLPIVSTCSPSDLVPINYGMIMCWWSEHTGTGS